MKTKNNKSSLKSLWEKHGSKEKHHAHNHFAEEEGYMIKAPTEKKAPKTKKTASKKSKVFDHTISGKWSTERH